jgi:hypothetical protein
MPCRVDLCAKCGEYDCPGFGGSQCIFPNGKKESIRTLDTDGALCDVLSMLEEKFPDAMCSLDRKTLAWWKQHEKSEESKTKVAALAKLSAKEKRALGLK